MRLLANRNAPSGVEAPPSPTTEGAMVGSAETMPAVRDAREYDLRATLRCLRDVGQLQLTVVSASGLHAADFGGKSDPFAVVELNSLAYTTSTQPKTLEPRWEETFVFDVADVTDILYVTVYDKDILGDPEFLGRIALPLLRIAPDGSEQSYALKSKRFEKRAKGMHPRITVRSSLIWNPARAGIRVAIQ